MSSSEAANNSATESNNAPPKQFFSGICKQVLDGGTVIIRGQPRNGPPPERLLALAEIEAPRLARRPGPNSVATDDEPFAWQAREFLRQMLVGKPLLGSVSYTVPSGREFGTVLVGSTDPEKGENVALKLVAEGLARVRENSSDAVLKEAQEAAKAAGKGVWSGDSSVGVRKITWDLDNPRQLVDQMGGKPVKAIIEHVRDGTTVRAFLLPDFHHITLMMSGVRAPSVRMGSDGKPDPATAEKYALEAHYFTESRLLQREVEIILESVNNKNFVGSVVHPNGNIAEALLREGFAKCVDWSLQCVTGGPEKYRKAQADAKEKKLRLWKDFAGPTGPVISEKDKTFTGKVIEIVNGDAVMVKRSKNDIKKIHLASIRPPRLGGPGEAGKPADRPKAPGGGPFRPLYDIPFMFEAREFLRKKLIGQNVHVTIDYIQPANNDFPEKHCATVTIGGVNVAEALVAKGLATVVRYAADNDQRSSAYDDLLAAEDKAIKSTKGMHDKKNIPTRRIADISGDVAKSKQFFPFLQRAGRMQCVVEFAASGSRFRVYIPRETCVITLLLSGVSCPRASRSTPGGQSSAGEPFGDEALAFVKEMALHREVDIEVEAMDKGGNFIGWMHTDGKNVSVELVENGFASAHVTADRTNYGREIAAAEENAKRRRERIWANYNEEEEKAAAQAQLDLAHEDDDKKEDEDRKVNYIKVCVTEVTPDAKIYAQHVDEGPKLEQLMKEIRNEFSSNPPLAGAYQPKKGDICAAKFVDDQWYRAKVEKVTPSEVSVLYMDYGNRATIAKTKVGTLPSSFTGLTPFAKEYCIALAKLADDEEYNALGLQAMREDFLDKTLNLNVEYRVGGTPYVTLSDPSSNEDLVKNLVGEGLLLAEKKGGRKLVKLVDSYLEAMETAKKKHLNIWEYGDITGDDAREFGVGNR